MTNSTIDTAAREYANRPKDERFPSIQALCDAALAEKNLSAERTYNLKDLQIVPAVTTAGDTLRLQSPRGTAKFTPWSFGQLCRTLGAPASYLREIPPAIAADALNFGLKDSAPSTAANLLVKAPNGDPEPTIRACTSDSYGRLWDAELYGSVVRQITGHDDRWTLPPTWSGEPAGAYRGDRDSFLIVTNGGSIVKDPSLSGGGIVRPFSAQRGNNDGGAAIDGLYRGLLIRNSEVGASSVVIETILYRYICGNHMLWGAMVDSSFRRRHFGSHVLRDTVREIGKIAYQWTNASAARDEAIIRSLIDHEIAHTKDAVVDELRAMGATKEQADAAYLRCEQTEAASPRSFWGAVQGLTRLSQDQPYQDERYQIDRIAASLLVKGRKLVAA
jgi:hypothetical protein